MTKHDTRIFEFDLAARSAASDSIPAVISSDTPVPRRGYTEVLRHDAGSIDLSRFPLPLLESHDSDDVNIGLCENPRIESGRLRADIRFGTSARGLELKADVVAGIVRGLSVGYQILEYTEDSETATLTATRWKPFECSVVAIPADTSAGFYRSLGKADANALQPRLKADQPTESRRDPLMEENTIIETPAEVTEPEVSAVTEETRAAEVDLVAVRAEAVAADRTRAREIRAAVKTAKLGDDVAESLINSELSLDAARSSIIQAWSEKMSENTGFVSIVKDERDNLRAGAEDFLAYRAGVGEVTDRARDFYGSSLLDLGARFVGPSARGMDKSTLFARVMETSDFPIAMANTMGKVLRQAYGEAEKTFEPFVRRVQVPDFKQVSRVQVGNYPSLASLAEGDNIQYGTFAEAKEVYTAATFAKGVAWSRAAAINDDLEALTRALRTSGFAAAALESDLVYGVLTTNAAMGDGVTLFHADHANLTTGAISVTSLSAIRKIMRLQQNLENKAMNLSAKYLLVPAALETVAEEYLASIYPTVATAVNPFSQKLQLIVEPRLDAASVTVFYATANPQQIDTVELASLSGVAPIVLDSYVDFESKSLKFSVMCDRGVKAIDYRGFVQSSGV